MSRIVSRLQQVLPAVVSLVIIVAAGRVLYQALSTIDAADVATHFRAIPVPSVALAVMFMLGAYTTLAIYEVQMLRYINAPVSFRRPLVTALIAYPVGHAVGLSALSGGAVRYRMYSAAGLSVFDIGKVSVLAVMPYAAGLGLLAGVSALIDTREAATFLRVGHGAVLAGAIVLLLSHAAYVAAVMRWQRPVSVRRFVIELPTPRMTAIQYALGILDALCGVAVLYVLLPAGTDIGFVPFVAVYVMAVAVGALSSVPAGLGVVESMLLLLLRDVPPDQLLGSVLAYRLIYELVPFLWAVALFVAYEAWTRRHWLRGRSA